jgi:hypothetical protein
MAKQRKLVWNDQGQLKVAYGHGITITGSDGSIIIFHGEKGDIILSGGMEFIIT